MSMLINRATLTAALAATLLAGCQASGQVGVTPGAQSPAPMASATPAMMTVSANFKATGTSTTATGTSNIGLSGDMKTLTIAATADGLSAMPTMAHIHRADTPGGSGPVVKDLQLAGNTASGTWSMADPNQPLSAALLDDLRAGRLYINFHTEANPGGELRGDLMLR